MIIIERKTDDYVIITNVFGTIGLLNMTRFDEGWVPKNPTIAIGISVDLEG